MASQNQIEANRRNAQASTGPRTQKGKARVGMNALKHGLTAERVLLSDENAHEFEEFRDRLWAALAPNGALEEMLATTFVADAWRLRRIPGLEAALSARHLQEPRIEKAQSDVDNAQKRLQQEFQRLLEPSTTSELEARMKRALETAGPKQRESLKDVNNKLVAAEKNLADAKQKMDQPALRVAAEFEAARETYATLSRYKATFTRSMLGALHELQRLQAARAGRDVAPPEVFDVHITGQESVAQSNGETSRDSAAMNGRSLG